MSYPIDRGEHNKNLKSWIKKNNKQANTHTHTHTPLILYRVLN